MRKFFIVLFLSGLFLTSAFGQEASEKLESFWEQIVATEYPSGKLPALDTSPGVLDALRSLKPSELRRSFENKGDTQDSAGIKSRFIHRFGAVAQVEWVADGDLDGLTGVFANGATGLVRFSTAVGDSVPGFGLKVFRDGALQSLNLMAMPGLNGLKEGKNFFSEPYRTTVKPAKLLSAAKVLEFPFWLAVRNPRVLNVSHFAELDVLSEKPEGLRVPVELVFVPTEEAQKAFRDDCDFRLALNAMPEEITLFDIYAVFDVKELTEGAGVKIGSLRKTSRFVSSITGDRLQFRHHRESLTEAFPEASPKNSE